MKTRPTFVLIGVSTFITAITTVVGLSPNIELKLLIFINTAVIMAIVLRKHLRIYYLPKKNSPTEKTTVSNTSWFVIHRLGLKITPPTKSAREGDPQKPRSAEIDKIVPVIEPIDPGTGSGKVIYKEMEWHAKSSNGETIALGERVLIVARDILTLVVEKIEST